MYESTQHSGGWYHVSGSYWANGALSSLNVLGLPQITYAIDGEGRTNQVSATSGTNPVTGTTYSPGWSRPTQLSLGSGDSDTFQYDSLTGRVTRYQFNIGANSASGALTWNPNGSLKTNAIVDPFNAANAQTCNYAYDDLRRLASVDCGQTVWQQNFTYDPFGNITKTVPIGGTGVGFAPTYNPATNRITSNPYTYDANGNTTQDNAHTYTWDAEGRPVTVDSVSLTYDARGYMVEQNRSGSYTQIVYGLGGGKLALMSGQTLVKAFIALPAGAVAVYGTTGTLSYFRHPDWLGSARISSDTSHNVVSDLAYAPFGETYAESGGADRSFTGQNQDTISGSTTGLYDFDFRELAQYGRWISPDPSGIGSVSLRTPQTWNRYAYVANNPAISRDSRGLRMEQIPCMCSMLDSYIGNFASVADVAVYPNGTTTIAGNNPDGPQCAGCSSYGPYASGYVSPSAGGCDYDLCFYAQSAEGQQAMAAALAAVALTGTSGIEYGYVIVSLDGTVITSGPSSGTEHRCCFDPPLADLVPQGAIVLAISHSHDDPHTGNIAFDATASIFTPWPSDVSDVPGISGTDRQVADTASQRNNYSIPILVGSPSGAVTIYLPGIPQAYQIYGPPLGYTDPYHH